MSQQAFRLSKYRQPADRLPFWLVGFFKWAIKLVHMQSGRWSTS